MQLREVFDAALFLFVLGFAQFVDDAACLQHVRHDVAGVGVVFGGVGDQVFHHAAECMQGVGYACRHSRDLLGVAECLPEGDALCLRVIGDECFGALPQAAFGHVEDAPHAHVVAGVGDALQVGDGILDFLAFVEACAADELIGYAGVDEGFLEAARLRVGAVHDGDVAVGEAILRDKPGDFAGDPLRLLQVVVGGVSDDGASRSFLRP